MIRKTRTEDADRASEIIEDARAYFASVNNPQWQDGRPNRDTVLQDIEDGSGYVLEENGTVIGTAALIKGPDPDYAYIEGQWLNDEPYYVIHRIAVDSRFKGRAKASEFLEYTAELAKSAGMRNIRIDTHEVNSSMRRFLAKNGFTECGKVYIRGTDPRIAYQKILNT